MLYHFYWFVPHVINHANKNITSKIDKRIWHCAPSHTFIETLYYYSINIQIFCHPIWFFQKLIVLLWSLRAEKKLCWPTQSQPQASFLHEWPPWVCKCIISTPSELQEVTRFVKCRILGFIDLTNFYQAKVMQFAVKMIGICSSVNSNQYGESTANRADNIVMVHIPNWTNLYCVNFWLPLRQ